MSEATTPTHHPREKEDAVSREWVADFETTTQADYEVDGYVRVFLWHARQMYGTDERLGYDIDSFISFLSEGNVKRIWFHNLRFDGSYILNRILQLGWTYSDKREQGKNTYSHIVTKQGAWMVLTLRFNTGSHKSKKNRCVVKICDSAKKFPGFSLEKIAKIYGIEGKSSLYLGYRGDDYVVTEEDIARVRGDTRILKVAMEDLIGRGMNRLTMSGDALDMYKSTLPKGMFEKLFPKLSLDDDKAIRHAYKGGWSYVNPKYQGKNVEHVRVFDVNSMYPWAMYNMPMPYGKPWISDEEPNDGVYIVDLNCEFSLKPGKFPSIQLKNNIRYSDTEYLAHSDGLTHLTLTNVDYDLFRENYNIYNLSIDRYICFNATTDLFKDYIDRWMAEKERASREGDEASKSVAKRYLNSLYGRFGMNPVKDCKMSRLEDGIIKWDEEEIEGDGGFLPVACFVTAYGRAKCIRAACSYGDGFVYADTDSVHVISDEHLLEEHPTHLGAWKLESESEYGRYLRPKTYVHAHRNYIAEFFTREDQYEIEEVKCAGMPDSCKIHVDWDNFEIGAEFEGKLTGKQVPGGYCLIDIPFRIKVGELIYD